MNIIIDVNIVSIDEGVEDNIVAVNIIIIGNNIIVKVITDSVVGINNDINIIIGKDIGVVTIGIEIGIRGAKANTINGIIKGGYVIIKGMLHFYRLYYTVTPCPI